MDELFFESKEEYISYLQDIQYIETTRFSVEDEFLKIHQFVEEGVMNEENAHFVYEDAMKDLITGLKNFIERIIQAIKDFFARVVRTKEDMMDEKELRAIVDAIKKDKEKQEKLAKIREKYDVYEVKEIREALDAYIRQMVVLERKLMNLRVDNKVTAKKNSAKANQLSFEYARLEKELDELNKKYETVLALSPKVKEMAAADAIRFSDEQLNHVRLDYNAIESGSTKVLEQFKKDANGCEVPVQASLFQKMSNSVATAVRKTEQKMTRFRKHNRTIIITVAAIAGVYATVRMINQMVYGTATPSASTSTQTVTPEDKGLAKAAKVAKSLASNAINDTKMAAYGAVSTYGGQNLRVSLYGQEVPEYIKDFLRKTGQMA